MLMSINGVIAITALGVSGWFFYKQLDKKPRAAGMGSTIIESIEVNVPVLTAYNQWTQFEDFPKFMDEVREVEQIDDTHLHWCASVGGKEKAWDVEITEQIPDKRIAWRSTSGEPNAGVVTFHEIGKAKTRIVLQMDYEPKGTLEKVGDMLGVVRRQMQHNLQRFKNLIESRGHETGAWRGAVDHGTKVKLN